VIHGIGIDLVEVAQFEDKAAAGGAGFLEGMFHAAEIDYCRAMRNPWPYLAARFAAKQALFKALGTLGEGAVSWRDVEVVHAADGRPSLVLRGETARLAEARRVARVHLSLTHEQSCVAALALIEVDERWDREKVGPSPTCGGA
jgi:holo-[acyl-carrier protein] synthase